MTLFKTPRAKAPPPSPHGCGCERLGICQDRPNCDFTLLGKLSPDYPFAPGIIEPPQRVPDGFWLSALQRVAALVVLVGVAGLVAGFLTGCIVP